MKIAGSMIKNLWLFLVVLLVMVANGLPVWLLSIMVVVLIGAPLIREFRKSTDLDERQIQLSHLSSHIAFYLLLILIILVMIIEFYGKGLNPDPVWQMLLIVPLLVKFFINLFQNYGAIKSARWIGYFFSAVWLLFVLLSHGLEFGAVMESLPFLLILSIAFYSGRYPVLGGILFILLSGGLSLFFGGWRNFDMYVRVLMFSLIPLPILISGVALIYQAISNNEKETSK